MNVTPFNNYGKKEESIIFEKFPGDKKKDKKRKNKSMILIIFIASFLFIGSSFLNEYYLQSKANYVYNKVNYFYGNYATVNSDERLFLLTKIGFSKTKIKKELKDDKTYLTYYGVNSSKYEDKKDSISVYYDDVAVSYVELNLSYKKNNFSYSKVVSDCNLIIKNFFNLTTDKDIILKTMQKGYYYYDNGKLSASYSLVLDSANNYKLNIKISR